jgi:hypothetical protein
LREGNTEVIVAGDNYHLLSWNREDNRIYFFRSDDESENAVRSPVVSAQRLFSCAPDGKRALTLGRIISKEEDLYWNLSPAGDRMVLFGSPSDGGIMNLTTGELVTIHMSGN